MVNPEVKKGIRRLGEVKYNRVPNSMPDVDKRHDVKKKRKVENYIVTHSKWNNSH